MKITTVIKPVVGVTLLAVCMMALFACRTPSSGGGATDSWLIAIPDEVTTTNPWAILGPNSTAYNSAVLFNHYPGVMGYSDVRFDWGTGLALEEPSPIVQEGNFWVSTVKLREGVNWSDGADVEAEDVVFTLQTILDFELPYGAVDRDFFDHAEMVDPYTVKYFFKKKPGLSVWQFGVALQGIMPEHVWAPIIRDNNITTAAQLYEYSTHEVVSAHEYVLGTWQKGAFVTLNPNPNYYWKDSTVNLYEDGSDEVDSDGNLLGSAGKTDTTPINTFKRGVAANSVTFSTYQTQDGAILALKENEVDYFLSPLGLSAGLRAQVDGVENIGIIKNQTNGFRYLAFNFRREPFTDLAFREAVATLINKELLTNNILQGAALPIYSTVPEGNAFWYNKDVTQIGKGLTRPERIAKAIEILKGAGYSWSVEPSYDESNRRVNPGEGLKDPSGTLFREMEILTPSSGYDPLRATAGIWIETWLQEAGIPIQAKLTGFNEIVDKVFGAEKDFDMWILGWGLTPFPDHVVEFFTEQFAGPDGNNAGAYINADFEELATEFKSETDVNKARDLIFRMQEFLAKDLPYITLFATPIYETYRSDKIIWPYTEVLDGLQNNFGGGNGLLSTTSFQQYQ